VLGHLLERALAATVETEAEVRSCAALVEHRQHLRHLAGQRLVAAWSKGATALRSSTKSPKPASPSSRTGSSGDTVSTAWRDLDNFRAGAGPCQLASVGLRPSEPSSCARILRSAVSMSPAYRQPDPRRVRDAALDRRRIRRSQVEELSPCASRTCRRRE
jgi:hypothetical protein